MATFWSTFISISKQLLNNKRKTLTSLWSKKLHYKFIQSTEDGDFILALDAEKLLRTYDCIYTKAMWL